MKDEYDVSKMKIRNKKVKVYPEAAKIMISLRLNTVDISGLKDEAERVGLPYQTLIGSILHRYITGELVDKQEARKLAK